MAKIRILPEILANRIAAGEVVERPASVVKELVENSLDAGANRIEVEIEGGGTRLIRVLDNGSGMDEDDVLLCFERHGTSKIHEAHDLVAINSLGFRGEAIPSIASVSKMTIISRTSASELGTEVVFEYGQLSKVHETGCRQGSVIEVRNLFGRTPARKKFLRTVRTEIGHIDEIIKNYALASPETAFILRVNGRESINLGSGQNREQRLRAILHYQDDLIPVKSPEQIPNTRHLHGFLVPPERTGSALARLRLFINGRAIRDRLMSHAAFEGLRGFLLKNHSPAGYLHLQLPAEEVDVNVHPAKHEVRFRNSGDIHQFIKQSVENAMLDHQRNIQSSYFTLRTEKEETPDSETMLPLQNTSSQEPQFVNERSTNWEKSHNVPGQNEKKGSFQKFVQSDIPSPPPLPVTHEPAPRDIAPRQQQDNATIASSVQRHGLRVIGQFKNLYIFCQAGDHLIVIDQHAAHERLLYEKFRKQYRKGKVASQNLLFPETIELSPLQIELVENNMEEMRRMGFDVAEFGGNSYVISAVPALGGQRQGRELFFDMLESFGSDGGKKAQGGELDHILATMACKAAIKSGDELSTAEIDALLNAMAEADLFSHCPHGRPVLKSFTDTEIQKWFYRT